MSTPITSMVWRITISKRTLVDVGTAYYIDIAHTISEQIISNLCNTLRKAGWVRVEYRLLVVVP